MLNFYSGTEEFRLAQHTGIIIHNVLFKYILLPYFTDKESPVNVSSRKRIHRVLRSQMETHSFYLIAAKLCGIDTQEKKPKT